MEELLVVSTASSQLPGRLLAPPLHAQDQNCILCWAGRGTRQVLGATQCCVTWHDLRTGHARGCDLHIYERWARARDGDNPGEWGMQSLSSCRERVDNPKRRSQHHSLSSVVPYPAENVLGKQCGMLLLSAVLASGTGGWLQTQVFKHEKKM